MKSLGASRTSVEIHSEPKPLATREFDRSVIVSPPPESERQKILEELEKDLSKRPRKRKKAKALQRSELAIQRENYTSDLTGGLLMGGIGILVFVAGIADKKYAVAVFIGVPFLLFGFAAITYGRNLYKEALEKEERRKDAAQLRLAKAMGAKQ